MCLFSLRRLACLALLAALVSLSGCKFLPGGSFYKQDNEHQDYINHDPTRSDS